MLLPNETVCWGEGVGVVSGDSLPPLSFPSPFAALLGQGTALGRGQLAAFVAASQEGRSVVCRSVYQLAFLCRAPPFSGDSRHPRDSQPGLPVVRESRINRPL